MTNYTQNPSTFQDINSNKYPIQWLSVQELRELTTNKTDKTQLENLINLQSILQDSWVELSDLTPYRTKIKNLPTGQLVVSELDKAMGHFYKACLLSHQINLTVLNGVQA